MGVEARTVEREDDYKNVRIHSTVAMGPEASFFLEVVRTQTVTPIPLGAMASGVGEQRLRLLDPEEVIDRAAAITMLAFERMKTEGWSVPMPGLDELKDDARKSFGFSAPPASESFKKGG